jgi:5-methylcytosine-specific restriction endonuclease McrA
LRRVARTACPRSLARNAARWTAELLAASADRTRNRRILDRLYSRYRTPDIQEALRDMYEGLCCYCEARVSHVSWENIEHRQPKRRFPEAAFEWSNLHLACPRCNTIKKDKWDSEAPILDAAIDDPVDHLEYRVGQGGIYRFPRTPRGRTTVDHPELNRHTLLEQRRRVFMDLIETIRGLREARRRQPRDPGLPILEAELRVKSGGEYGSMIAFYISELLD